MRMVYGFILIVFLNSYLLLSQHFSYDYDDAGNRIIRVMVSPKEGKPQVKEISNFKITLSPNPTTGVLRLELEGLETSDNTKIKIYDLQGAEVYFKEDFGNSLQIDLTNQVNGVYLLDIHIGDKRSYWKIIKEE